MLDKVKNIDKTCIVVLILLIMSVSANFLQLRETLRLRATISTHKCPTVAQSDYKPLSQTTELTVAPKSDTESPDLIIDTEYVATINKQKVKVPMRPSKELTGTKGATSVTASIKQEIDVTELVKPLVPKWEVGAGVGVHDSDVYIPLSVQRNYAIDKGIEFEVHLSKQLKPNGVAVVHKWRF